MDTLRTHDPESTLLPCPFCGGAARMDRLAHKETHGYDSYSPECASCGTSLLPAEDIPTHELAVAAWNHRAPDPRLAAFDEVVTALSCFLDDDRFHITVGGNPNVVETMINNAHAALARVRELESKS